MTTSLSKGLTWACLCVIAAALSQPAFGQTNDDLLQFAIAASQARWSGIESGRGTVALSEWRLKNGERLESELTFTGVFSGERFRLLESRTSGGEALLEVAFDGAKTTVWGRDGKLAPAVRIKSGRDVAHAGRFDAYFDPRVRDIAKWPSSGPVRALGKERLNGDDCVVLLREETTDTPKGRFAQTLKFWVDLDKGCTVRKMEFRDTLDGETMTSRVIENEVRQYACGLWACSRSRSVSYDGAGNKVKEQVITYAPDFEINVPVTDADLQVKLPSGTAVFDEMVRMEYVVP